MKITCPKCKTQIPVNPAAMMGSISSEAKTIAARLNAQKPRKRKPAKPLKWKTTKPVHWMDAETMHQIAAALHKSSKRKGKESK